MNVCSQCLWEKTGSVDINPISVVLQQVSTHKKETLLACVCEGFGEEKEGATWSGYFTERLVEWFHGTYLKKLLEKGGETEITKALKEEVERTLEELRRYAKKKGELQIQYSGILIRNNQCWILGSGSKGLYLFNRRYNKEQAKPIIIPEGSVVWEGRVQKNIGILLCSDSLRKVYAGLELSEVLFREKKCDEAGVEKRLKELWREGQIRGIENVGAVYICTY